METVRVMRSIDAGGAATLLADRLACVDRNQKQYVGHVATDALVVLALP